MTPLTTSRRVADDRANQSPNTKPSGIRPHVKGPSISVRKSHRLNRQHLKNSGPRPADHVRQDLIDLVCLEKRNTGSGPASKQVTLLTRDHRVTYKGCVDSEDLVFKALADATRRLLLDKLFERDGMTLGELEAEVPELTRFGVMKHLGVLEQAGLVVTRKQGRHKHHYLNAVPIRLLLERWIDKYRNRRAAALLDLKDHLEGTK
jgi:DNA-binding transcriptional ArsR family regulator